MFLLVVLSQCITKFSINDQTIYYSFNDSQQTCFLRFCQTERRPAKERYLIRTLSIFFLTDPPVFYHENIRILHECEVRIENSVPRVTDLHHEVVIIIIISLFQEIIYLARMPV